MIKGVFAPIPTPFKNDEIDFVSFEKNLAKWGTTPLTGVVVLGSNGEFAYMNYEEKAKLIEFTRKNLPQDKQVIAGTGCESTKETVALTQAAAEMGCDAALVLTPHYYKGAMTDLALKQFFTTVADESKIPILLYNMPKNAGINLSSKVVADLAQHENIVGVKDSSGNIIQIAEICANTPDDFSVLAGSGSFLLPALAVGAVGGVMAVANIMSETCVELKQAFEQGDLGTARRLQHLLLAPNAAVTARFGVGGLKHAMSLLGFSGGEVRRPMLPVSEEAKSEIEHILGTAGVLK